MTHFMYAMTIYLFATRILNGILDFIDMFTKDKVEERFRHALKFVFDVLLIFYCCRLLFVLKLFR